MSEPTEAVEEVTETASLDSNQTESPSVTGEKFGYDEGITEGIKQERERVQSLFEAATDDQGALLSDLIVSGTTTLEGLKALLSDHKSRVEDRLAHQLNATPEPVGPESTETQDEKSVFESNPKLLAEFGSFDVYEAYMKADEAGAIRGRIS